MLLIGNQLKAARALAEVEQQELADAASVHVNTIRKMEAKGRAEITSAADVLRRVQFALERFGIEFTNDGKPGVCVRSDVLASKAASRRQARPAGTRPVPKRGTTEVKRKERK
jgi:transcriptional regulator with XRE-family HTH domain